MSGVESTPDDEELPRPELDAPSDVGAAMREEWRVEQEEITRDAAEVWQHARTLLDVAREYMHRGDRVVVTAAGHRIPGDVDLAAQLLLGLLNEAGAVIAAAPKPQAMLRRVAPTVDAMVERLLRG